MTYSFLLIEKQHPVATIVLNRPDRYNALNKVLCKEIASVITELNKDASIKVIRIKGAGKGFCAGLDLFEVDLKELKQAGKIVTELFNPIVDAIKTSTKPIVAQVTGTAAGAGCSLALACDIVYAGSQAVFSLPFFKIALLPDTGASYFIVKQLGYKKAFELFSGNASLKAQEAEVCHLINHVVDEQELEEASFNYCLKLSQEQSENLGNLKALLQAAETETLAEILNLEAYYQDQAAKAPTFEQAIKQFKERK